MRAHPEIQHDRQAQPQQAVGPQVQPFWLVGQLDIEQLRAAVDIGDELHEVAPHHQLPGRQQLLLTLIQRQFIALHQLEVQAVMGLQLAQTRLAGITEQGPQLLDQTIGRATQCFAVIGFIGFGQQLVEGVVDQPDRPRQAQR